MKSRTQSEKLYVIFVVYAMVFEFMRCGARFVPSPFPPWLMTIVTVPSIAVLCLGIALAVKSMDTRSEIAAAAQGSERA
ncbi:MAG: hypothetical protein IAI50_05925 [Candidatus Eremiobacteraeota bacterium]|nr:hypothetical protein [Candidatus Eremiobacteraeota bacterium]